MTMRPPGSVNLIALEIRLLSTISIIALVREHHHALLQLRVKLDVLLASQRASCARAQSAELARQVIRRGVVA